LLQTAKPEKSSQTQILEQASIVPPQIAQIFINLSDMGFPKDVIDVYEAREILLKAFHRRHKT